MSVEEVQYLLGSIAGSNVLMDAVKGGNTELDECMHKQDDGERCLTLARETIVRLASCPSRRLSPALPRVALAYISALALRSTAR